MSAHEANPAAQEVVTHVTNRVGFIELERPKALNALNLDMIRAIHAALDRWRDDTRVLAVVVLSRHARAFCAGGDVRHMYDAWQAGDHAAVDTFFIEEYRLDHAIFTYPKPYIALMNGIVMGGGMGIAQGARHTGGLRVVGGSTRVAMPETRIGLFPDVGVSWFLARSPGALGRYLAVTGATVGAADALYAGLADVYLDDAGWPALLDALRHGTFRGSADVVACIARAARGYRVAPAPDASPLAHARTWIDRHFSHPDVPRIAASLEAAAQRAGDEAAWAQQTLQMLRERSPLSMAVSLEVVARSDGTMADCLRRDLDLTRSSFRDGDVVEGIRARLVDKDNLPQWRIPRIDAVRPEDVERMFVSPWTPDEHPLRALRD